MCCAVCVCVCVWLPVLSAWVTAEGATLAWCCLQEGPRQCWAVWAIVGGVALLSPLSLHMLRDYIAPDRNAFHSSGTDGAIAAATEGDGGVAMEMSTMHTHSRSGLAKSDELQERKAEEASDSDSSSDSDSGAHESRGAAADLAATIRRSTGVKVTVP